MSAEMSDTIHATFQVTWGDLDANGHMANRGFLDYTTQARFLFLASRGFTPVDFRKHGIGPVVTEDRLRYVKELMFLDRFNVDFATGEISDDDSRFRIRNRFFRKGDLCAEIHSDGAWFSLRERKVVSPPPELAAIMRAAPAIDG
jgi:acyl-CoA thioester hydrolase